MFGQAAFAHGKCFDRLLLWCLFFFFPSLFSTVRKVKQLGFIFFIPWHAVLE